MTANHNMTGRCESCGETFADCAALQERNRARDTAQGKALRLGIVNPNTSGQGFHPGHANIPGIVDVVGLGWIYSHTTNVIHNGDENVLHHTFTRGDHRVSFWWNPLKGWRWGGSWGGSGRETTGSTLDVKRYLRGVRRRARNENRPGF
jgi:hypothetical protein